MKLTIEEFLLRNKQKLKVPFPNHLQVFRKNANALDWQIKAEGTKYIFEYTLDGKIIRQEIDEFLQTVLASKESIDNVHYAISSYFRSSFSFKDGLPIYMIRRHGSRAGIEGSSMRRRGWLVRFDNAYIVYSDNFFPRHFFEYAYFASSVSSQEINNLINRFQMPFSSGGGSLEKLHRAFPALNHLTSTSNLYLSHIYDLNRGNYFINGQVVRAEQFLERGCQAKFGCGLIKDWENGVVISGGVKCRIINETLSDETLCFLKSYNIRALSPLNYFPFPKQSLLKGGSVNGENENLREYIINYYQKSFNSSFADFQTAANACP